MSCKETLEKYLGDQGVAFQIQHHPLAYTAQEVAASEHISGNMLVKVVMAFADDRLLMLALPASFRVDLDKAAGALGAKAVRLASEEEFGGALPDCEVGAIPPFGPLYDLPVYVDRSLTEEETIVIRAGTHTETLSLRYADFARLVLPTVVELAEHS